MFESEEGTMETSEDLQSEEREFLVIEEFPEHLRALPLHELQPTPNLIPRSGPLKLRSIDLGLYNLPGADEFPHPKKCCVKMQVPRYCEEPPEMASSAELLRGIVVFRRPFSPDIRGALSQRLIDPKWIFCQNGPELQDEGGTDRMWAPSKAGILASSSSTRSSSRDPPFSSASKGGLPQKMSTTIGASTSSTASTASSRSSNPSSSRAPVSTAKTNRPATAPMSRRRFNKWPIFDSAFEGGNLACVVRSDEDENVFDLILDEDINGCGNTQWYFFSVEGMRPGQSVVFRILNLGKNRSLYEEGQRPLAYCVDKEISLLGRDTAEHFPPWETCPKAGWSRAGTDVVYTGSNMYKSELYNLLPGDVKEGAKITRAEENYRSRRGPELYMLQWRYTFETAGLVYFAAAHPYSFTRLLKVLDTIEMDPVRRKYATRSILCTSISRNRVDCMTITDPHSPVSQAAKRVVCITARVHPGETVSSIVCEGILDFLTSESAEADKLRKHFCFKIVPMLNPDGVINGNYRTSALGVDLNRRWRWASRDLHPSIWHMKRMLNRVQLEESVALYIDLHGHSRRLDWFCYGCRTSEMGSQSTLDPLVLPIALRQRSETFNLNYCSFQVASCKDQTARVTAWRELKVAAAYTIEVSLAGTSLGKSNKENSEMVRHFVFQDFWDMGKAICCAMIPQIRYSVQDQPTVLEEVFKTDSKEFEQFLDEVVQREYIPDSENDGDLSEDCMVMCLEKKEKKRRKRRNSRHPSFLRTCSHNHGHQNETLKTSHSAPSLSSRFRTVMSRYQEVDKNVEKVRDRKRESRPELKPAQGLLFEFPDMRKRKPPPAPRQTFSLVHSVSGKLHPYSIGAYVTTAAKENLGITNLQGRNTMSQPTPGGTAPVPAKKAFTCWMEASLGTITFGDCNPTAFDCDYKTDHKSTTRQQLPPNGMDTEPPPLNPGYIPPRTEARGERHQQQYLSDPHLCLTTEDLLSLEQAELKQNNPGLYHRGPAQAQIGPLVNLNRKGNGKFSYIQLSDDNSICSALVCSNSLQVHSMRGASDGSHAHWKEKSEPQMMGTRCNDVGGSTTGQKVGVRGNMRYIDNGARK